MQKINNETCQLQNDQCPVCGGTLTNGVCVTCGWIQILFPKEVPVEIEDFNAMREEVARKIYQEANISKTSLSKVKTELDEVKGKADKLQKSLTAASGETHSAKKDCDSYRKKLENADKNIISLEKKCHDLSTENQRLTSQSQTVKSQSQILKNEVSKLKAEIQAKSKNMTPVNGAQIYVTENEGKYKLYDVAKVVRRSNGTVIGNSGIELYDGCIFDIGDITFKVSVPEFNIDSLIF